MLTITCPYFAVTTFAILNILAGSGSCVDPLDLIIKTSELNPAAYTITPQATTRRRYCPSGEWYEKRGTTFTSNFRLYFCDNNGNVISPWHDIPLRAINDGGSAFVDSTTPLFNFIVEIPRHAHAKMEINKFLPLNPIMQDKWKDGSPRFVGNLWPYQGYLWNYGAFPQTFEDPKYECPRTAAVGDFDPVDVIEIGNRKWSVGSVIKVKVLGILPLIDQGESDWKVIVIYYKDPLAAKLHSLADIERLMPGFVNDTARWFTLYKLPVGKKRNVIAMSGFVEDVTLAHTIIEEVHMAWRHLHLQPNFCQQEFGIYCNHTSPNGINRFFLSQSQAQLLVDGPEPTVHDAPLPSEIDAWSFIDDYRWYNHDRPLPPVPQALSSPSWPSPPSVSQQQQQQQSHAESADVVVLAEPMPIDSFTCNSADTDVPCS